jgi:TolA-binding protein
MRKPSPSSKYVIAALVAAALGLTAGPALAQTTPQSSQGNQSNTSASHRPASKKSVQQLSSQVKQEREQMQATTGKLNRATAQLNQTTRRMKQAQSKEMRVASAEHRVRKGEHMQRNRMHPRNRAPANTTPPPR